MTSARSQFYNVSRSLVRKALFLLFTCTVVVGSPLHSTFAAINSSPGLQTLLSELDSSIGTRKLVLLSKLAEFHDPELVPYLINLIDVRDSLEIIQVIKSQLVSYGADAEGPIIEFMQLTEEQKQILICIDVLCKLKSTKAIRPYLELLNKNQDRKLQEAINECLLVMGDRCAGSLINLLPDEALGDRAKLFLYNTVSIDELKNQLLLLGGELTTAEARSLASVDDHKKADFLISKILSIKLGKKVVPSQFSSAQRQEFDLKTFIIEQITLEPNVFFIAGIILSVVLLGFIMSQIVVPNLLPRRGINKYLEKVEKLIKAKNWQEALKTADAVKVKHSTRDQIDDHRRNLKASIFRAKAEDELERGNYDVALKDYDAYCRMTGRDSQSFKETITRRKIDALSNEAWQLYSQQSIAESKQIFLSVLREDYTNWKVHFALGLIYLEDGSYHEAVRELHSARTNLDAPSNDIAIILAIALSRMGDYGGAVDALDPSRLAEPSKLSLFYFGKCATALESALPRAIERLETLISSFDTLPLWGVNSLIEELQDQYGFSERVTSEDTANLAGAAHWVLGQAYLKTRIGDQKAEEEFKKAQQLGYRR